MLPLDRIGAVATLVTAAFLMAAEVIDQVNTGVEKILVVLAFCGAVFGALRAARMALRWFGKLDRMVTLLEGLEDRLKHGDMRMTRLEKRVGLPPLPYDQEDRDAA